VKTIPSILQTHKNLPATTLCVLFKLTLRDGTVLGFTNLDIAVTYNDGDGAVVYDAATGFRASNFASTLSMSVDNAEAQTLVPQFESGQITNAMIAAGDLDYATWIAYRVNFNDLTSGRHEIVGSGTTGEVVNDDSLGATLELRAISQLAKQSVVELDSITCRARFGSQPIGTGGGVVEERFPCGKDISAAWVAGTVDSVGAESDRTFTSGDLAGAGDNFYVPGRCRWLTGANAGRMFEIEDFDDDGTVTLAFPTASTILAADTFEVLKDCNKVARDTAAGCKYHWGTDWGLHFRGEPDTPVGDEAALSTPGASL
jgi:uncharacterized phage protein (TIGR02218 family)